ncbi:hypothetical protein Tco_0805716 [Tanacetum coccineum]
MVPYQSSPQNSQIVLASQLDIFKKTTEGSMQVMRNHITNLKAEIRSESIPTAKRTFLPTGATQSLAPLLMRMTFDEKEPGVHKDKVHRAPKTSSLGCPKSHDPGKPVAGPISEPSLLKKWATNEFVKDNDEINHEDFKSDNENVLGVHDNEEEEIAFLDGLLEDENFFEINDKKVESLERKTKEDFETKDEPKSKKELQVFHPNIEILNHFETTSYVGSDYVFYEDFNLVDMLFPMNIQGKIFDPGITFHEKSFENDVFKDKSSKELAPSKSLLTLDVFDPLHPPLMDFHVTKAFSGFIFSLLKFFSKKFFKPGINNATSKPTKKRKRQDKSEEWKPILKAGSARYNKKRVNEEPIEEKGLIINMVQTRQPNNPPDAAEIIAQQLQNIIPNIVTQLTNNLNNGNGNGNGGGNNGCTYKGFVVYGPRYFDGTGGAVALTRGIEKMESMIDNSG